MRAIRTYGLTERLLVRAPRDGLGSTPPGASARVATADARRTRRCHHHDAMRARPNATRNEKRSRLRKRNGLPQRLF
jgi:hypothetical protein